jgi:hypothetical protein
MYAGLKDGHRAEKVTFVLGIDEVADLLDDDQTALQKCIEIFTRAFAAKGGQEAAQQ